MIVLLELIALSGLVWGLVLACCAVGKHQKLYYIAHPSLTYVKGDKVFRNKSVWRFPFTRPVMKIHQNTNPTWVRGDILTQFGVVNVEFMLHARIKDPLCARTFAGCDEFNTEHVLSNCSHKIKSVLQSAINEAGNAEMSYTPQLHMLTEEKMKLWCHRHGLELEEMSFSRLETVGATTVTVENQAPVLQHFNSGAAQLQNNFGVKG